MKLYHEFGTHYSEELISKIRTNGISVDEEISHRWADIDEVIPNRPHGIFFWGEDLKHAGYDIIVDTADIDTSKLFGFSAEYAEVANQVSSLGTKILRPGALEILANAQPIRFEDWDGKLPVEWIYTGDIPAEAVEIA